MKRLIGGRFPAAALAAFGCLALLLAFLPVMVHGATLFSDDFEDGNAAGWSTSGGSWSVVTDGSRVYRQGSTSADASANAGSTGWVDQVMQARVKPLAFNGSNRHVGVLARVQNSTNYYYLALSNNNTVVLGKRVSGARTTLASQNFSVATGQWYTLKLEVQGTTLRGFVDGVERVSIADGSFSSGKIGLVALYSSAAFDDVFVSDSGSPPAPTATSAPNTPTATASATATAAPTATPGATATATPGTPPPPPGDGPIGFASVDALGQNGTTGGAGGPEVTVTSSSQFLDYIGRSGPYLIYVEGMLSLPGGMHNVASDKTIIGLGSNSGISGGGLNIGLSASNSVTEPPANAVHNIIIRNMNITNCPDDCINIQMFSHHIWVDHNDLSGAYDGALDIKRGSDYITVSWNHFHNQDKNMLLGHDDNNGDQDIGRLRVTYHHNWFNGVVQRNPRVRFGEPVHVFNNYYLNVTGYGVASQMNAGVLVEGNYFENVTKPTRIDVGGEPRRIVQRSNIFVNSDPPVSNGSVVEPSSYYSYSLDSASDVPANVRNGAGVGKIGY